MGVFVAEASRQYRMQKIAFKYAVAFLVLMLLINVGICSPAAEAIQGKWLAPDESSAGVTSVVDLYVRHEHLFGRILITRNAQGQEIHPICEKCPGPLRGMPIKGMEFIRDLKPDSRGWVDGQVLDLRPGITQGMFASCDVSVDREKVHFFGYLLSRALGKVSIWTRLKDDDLFLSL